MPHGDQKEPTLLPFDFFRQTRSRKTFSPFSGPAIDASPDFDLKERVSTVVSEQAKLFWTCDSPLTSPDSSPLSSPPSSPCPSPLPSRCSTPVANPVIQAEPSNRPSVQKSRAKRRSHKNRRNKRKMKKEADGYGFYEVRDSIKSKYLKGCTKDAIEVAFDIAEASVAPSAFVGNRQRLALSKRTYNLQEIVDETGFRVIEWDGKTPRPIIDREGRMVALLAGHPDDPDWGKVHREAANLLEQNRKHVHLPPKLRDNRRGPFPTAPFGVSHGGGRTKPCTRPYSKATTSTLQKITLSEPFQRLANFLSAAFAAWAPKLYNYYVNRLGSVFANDSKLQRSFVGSVFPAASYNFGPTTVCCKHYDSANLPFGWCGISALGQFNPKRGGHIILWELGLIIEFPPGSTIFIPSAIIAHQNVSICEGETRYSFTQYAAGDLFRWAEHGFTTDGRYFSNLTPEKLEEQRVIEEERWSKGVDLFSKVSDYECRT